jgi:hypothetical protein
VTLASQCRGVLAKKIAGFGKAVGADGLPDAATDLFYQRSEARIHELLRHDIADELWRDHRRKLAEELSELCTSIFEQLTEPYRHKPKMMIALAKSRASLGSELRRLVEVQ